MINETVCFACKNLVSYPKCLAFPEGIPESIRVGKINHKANIKGDNGIKFIPIISNKKPK